VGYIGQLLSDDVTVVHLLVLRGLYTAKVYHTALDSHCKAPKIDDKCYRK